MQRNTRASSKNRSKESSNERVVFASLSPSETWPPPARASESANHHRDTMLYFTWLSQCCDHCDCHPLLAFRECWPVFGRWAPGHHLNFPTSTQPPGQNQGWRWCRRCFLLSRNAPCHALSMTFSSISGVHITHYDRDVAKKGFADKLAAWVGYLPTLPFPVNQAC